MRIKLQEVNESELILTDEELDNDNYVDLAINGEATSVNLDELLSAVHAFEQKRVMRITRENKYQE